MDINELRSLQETFDKEHGWGLKSNKLSELVDMLHRDLVGLLGEIGEFANILKKITLIKDSYGIPKGNKMFKESKEQLAEELIDAMIYLFRMATHLKIDIEKEYLIKLDYNKLRYKEYEI